MTNVERRRALVDLAVRNRITIIEDDPYGDLYFDSAPPPSVFSLAQSDPDTRNWIVYLSSLSKIVSPGLRVGWAVLPAHLIAPFTIAKQASDLQSSTFNQHVAQRYLANGSLGRHLPKLRAGYRARCQALCAALKANVGHNQVVFQEPLGGMFVWAKLRPDIDAEILVERAIEQGVVYVPGRSFFASDPETNTLRLTFATATSEQFDAGTKRLAAAIAMR